MENPRPPRAYRCTSDSTIDPEVKEGTILYEFRGCDYGLASDDTRMTGVEHVSLSKTPDGAPPSITHPRSALVPVEVAPPEADNGLEA